MALHTKAKKHIGLKRLRPLFRHRSALSYFKNAQVGCSFRRCCNIIIIIINMTSIALKGNSSVTHVTFFQFFYFHRATIKHLVVQSNKFKAYGDLGVQFYIST